VWLAPSLAILLVAACSSKSNGTDLSDDTSSDDDSGNGSSSGSAGSSSSSESSSSGSTSGSGTTSSGSTSSSGTGNSSGSSGSHPADGGSSPNQRVDSGIPFSDAGVPYCSTKATCDLKSNTCCVDVTGVGSCHSGHSVNCGIGASFQCIEKTDCPSGQLCCGYQTDSTHGGSNCQPSCPSQTSAQLCQTNGECAGGVECIPQACDVGALVPANLTLCGLQSNATYKCMPR
jgi:hypothetical protein